VYDIPFWYGVLKLQGTASGFIFIYLPYLPAGLRLKVFGSLAHAGDSYCASMAASRQ
jgi:hypothetical protein